MDTTGAFLVIISLLVAPTAMSQLQINATTPAPIDPDNPAPNTFVAPADSFAGSLLAATNPGAHVMLWGSVSPSSVGDACNLIVDTGTHQLGAIVTGSSNGGWGDDTFNTTLTLRATGGCNSAADNSGTQLVFDDENDRRIAIVCPDNAGDYGCGIYWTGDDVSAVYDSLTGASDASGRKLLGRAGLPQLTGRQLLSTTSDGCVDEVKDVGGDCAEGTLLEGTAACIVLGPFAPLCGAAALAACVAIACGAGAGHASGCFPGSAEVLLRSGQHIPMTKLSIGDEVAVLARDGTVVYDAVYAFGHNDPMALSMFVKLSTDTHELRLSPDHFVQTATGNTSAMVYKRAQDVDVGNYIWTTASSESSSESSTHGSLQMVTDVTLGNGRGLYNPLTLSGTIIVGGVAASVHSHWFLDGIFDALGIHAWLPAAYQAVLAPARLLYAVLGKEIYIQVYSYLDVQSGGLAGFGTRHGGEIAAGSACALAGLLMMTVSQSAKTWGVNGALKSGKVVKV